MTRNQTRLARRAVIAGTAAYATLRPGRAEESAAAPSSDAPQEHRVEAIRLDGPGATLVLLLHPRGLPEIAYWGVRLPDAVDAARLREALAAPPRTGGVDGASPGATLMPTAGSASQVAPALAAHRAGLDWTAAFDAVQVRRSNGSCVVFGRDPVARLAVEIHLGLGEDDVLSARAVLINEGEPGLVVDRFAAAVFPLPADVEEARLFEGRWGREFQERRVPLSAGVLEIETRGNRSHSHFPGLLAGSPGYGEETGTAYGFQLAWSGGQRITAERAADGRVLVTLGEALHPGEVVLAAGERFETPSAHATVSPDGLAGVSRRFHAHVRRSVLRWPGGVMRPRPVTLNTWEGNDFALREDQLLEQAEAAARLGIERFVLDDGWFRGRRSDRAGLGDWTPDPTVFPRGLAPLARRVNELGMEFGLWFEPEMVSPDSDLYRAHPDWVLGVRGRPLVTGRHQLVLDLTRPEVAEHIFAALDTQLRKAPIAYVKWDMNRDLIHAGDGAGRPAYRRQVLAVYALLDRLREAHPALEIESCASGGGRADLGIMRRALRVWPSDCTDALERLRIQSGFLRFLPPELMGAHVSASPNQQTGRELGLGFRACVAMFGHFGVEMDPRSLSPEQAEELAGWIALHKRLRPLLHGGLQHSLPERFGRILQGVVAPDGARALYLVAQVASSPVPAGPPVVLPGLDPARSYRVTQSGPQAVSGRASPPAEGRLGGEGLIAPGSLLRHAGLPLPEQAPETALLLHAEAIGA